MKKDQIKLGGTYRAKVSGKVVSVRLDAESPHGGWQAFNLETHKTIRIKSAQRLRGPATDATTRTKAVAQAQAADAVANAHAVSPEQKVANAAGEALAAAPAPKGKRKPWRERAAVINAEHNEKVEAELKAEGEADGKMSGLDAAAKILAEAEMPLNAKMIVERIIAQGLWSTGGKTPAATIYSAMLREIDGKPGESRFKKVDRGLFTLATSRS